MPAYDLFHETVREALIKDGWTITDDPLHLKVEGRNLFVDLGAERWITAERGTEQIAVEIKGFSGRSEMRDLEQALGQYTLYETILEEEESVRTLYLAVTKEIFESLFSDKIGEVLIRRRRLHLLIFDAEEKEILQWIPTRNDGR